MFDFDEPVAADNALNHQGYSVTVHSNDLPTYTPSPTITQWVADVGSNLGAFLHDGHGDADALSIEVYPGTLDGWAFADSVADRYLDLGLFNTLWISWPEDWSGLGIGIPWEELSSKCSFSDAVVDIEACGSVLSGTWTGARVECVCDVGLTKANGNLDMAAIWGGLDGTWGRKYRTINWAITNASSQCHLREGQTGGGRTTLAPCVKWTDATPNELIPSGGMTIRVLFDTHVDETIDPMSAWWADDRVFTLQEAAWEGDTLISAHVHPIANTGENRTGALTLQWSKIHAENCPDLFLDGDAKGGPSDWAIDLKYDDAPAAAIEGVNWANGVFTWYVATEFHTAGYRIEGNTPPDETWHSIGDLLPPGVGDRSVAVGNAYALYRVVEVEEGGHEFIGDIIGSGEKVMPPLYPPRSFDALLADYEANLESPLQRGGNALLNGEKVVVYVPSAWMNTITPLLSYLQANYGVEWEALSVESFSTDPTQRFAPIKASIAQHYGQGYRSVLLGGDASDYQYFDTNGPYRLEYWPTSDWEIVRGQYLGAGYASNPANLIIPTKVIKDQLYRGKNVSWYQPYYMLSDDISYGDVDGDSLPDMAVGRWPCDNIQEFTALCNKTLTYLQRGYQDGQTFTTNVFLGDVDFAGTGDGAHAAGVLASIKGMLDPATLYNTVRASQHPDAWERTLASVAEWNAGSELAIFVSAASGPYNPGDSFNVLSGYSIDMIQTSNCPFVIGASCGTADEYQSEISWLGPNFSHDMLMADDKGCMVWMGPSAGTTQEGNRAMGQRIAYRLQQNPARGGAESFRLAQRDVLMSLPAGDWDKRIVARSYQYLGFPLLPLMHRAVTSGVEETSLDFHGASKWPT